MQIVSLAKPFGGFRRLAKRGLSHKSARHWMRLLQTAKTPVDNAVSSAHGVDSLAALVDLKTSSKNTNQH